ncbi:MAG: hypothetical protein LBE18_01485 [Planctomycetaceae bacterium]|jgi:hypothetical protein|nr:hypothetical protein [Planctomycetaceae bacterium]
MTEKTVNSNIESESQNIDSILQAKAVKLLESSNCFSSDDFIFEYISEGEPIKPVSLAVGNSSCERSVEYRQSVWGDPEGGAPKQIADVPPITNRGVSKYQGTICYDDVKSENMSDVPIGSEVIKFQRGGYDGGVEIGFEGRYLDGFAGVLSKLENAKQQASENSISCPLEICGRRVLVECSGANAGLHYKYVFTLDGVKFLVHHNPPKGRQAIRIRYGATALIGRNFFQVHQDILKFLNLIGFVINRECISRIDLQVLVENSVDEFIGLIFSGHAIAKSRKDIFHRDCGQTETYTLGNAGRIQLCIYDKRKEISHALISDPVKFELVLRCCFGSDLYFSQVPITRVEFRLWRDVLREIGINTVSDLYLRENDLVKWLTNDWFRLLSNPKVRGHENTAAIHPIWQNVIKSFDFWFSHAKREKVGIESQPIQFNRDERISCNPELLEKQGFGCISKALAYRYGIKSSGDELRSILTSYIQERANMIYSRVNNNAQRIEIMKGVVLGENLQRDELQNGYNEFDCFIHPENQNV